MPTENFQAELSTALEASARAAEILIGRSGADHVREKGPSDLVTLVDEASERVIQETIRAAFPHDGFVAEEFSAASRPSGRRWIVDPVDGTVNFVHGHPFACVSIAFVDDEGPAVGVINAPFLGEIFSAVRGYGAYLNDQTIRVSAVPEARAALLATGFPFKAGKGDPQVYMEMVGEMLVVTHGVRRAGAAALDLAYVACGRVDGFFELGLAPWDVAAGFLLVAEAGGTISGWEGDQGPPLTTGRVIASNGRIHDWLRAFTGRYVSRL